MLLFVFIQALLEHHWNRSLVYNNGGMPEFKALNCIYPL